MEKYTRMSAFYLADACIEAVDDTVGYADDRHIDVFCTNDVGYGEEDFAGGHDDVRTVGF